MDNYDSGRNGEFDELELTFESTKVRETHKRPSNSCTNDIQQDVTLKENIRMSILNFIY
jgi:hypothetical protein